MTQELFEQRRAAFQAALEAGKPLAEPAVFYSIHASGLVLNISSGTLATDAGGNKIRLGEKTAEFTKQHVGVKMPDGRVFRPGMYQTTDPETALAILLRGQKHGDIVMTEEYIVFMTPVDVKLQQETARRLESQNELELALAKIRQQETQIAALAAKPAGKSPQQGAAA